MLWRIVKSLDNVAAVLVDSVPKNGVCIEFKNFHQKDASILIYQNGKLEDIIINGCTFPCVYNKIPYWAYRHDITFDFIDPLGAVCKIQCKNLYGEYEAIVVEYFYTFLHYITYCDSREELYGKLYMHIIDSDYIYVGDRTEKALNTLCFIEEFTPQLSNIKDATYLRGLKQKLNVRFKEAQEVISKAKCPE